MESSNYIADFLEEHWQEWVDYCGSEETAQAIIDSLRNS